MRNTGFIFKIENGMNTTVKVFLERDIGNVSAMNEIRTHL